MTVDYYEIRDCVVGQLGSRTVLAAPPQEQTGIPSETLMRHGFLKEADGRWYHELTAPELQLLQSSWGNVKVSFGGETPPQEQLLPMYDQPGSQKAPYYPADKPMQDAPAANYLAGGSLLSMLLSVFLPHTSNSSLYVLRGVFFVTGWVLLILTRVKYPKNTFAKVLMWVYIVLCVLIFFAMIAAGIALAYACSECVRSCPD